MEAELIELRDKLKVAQMKAAKVEDQASHFLNICLLRNQRRELFY